MMNIEEGIADIVERQLWASVATKEIMALVQQECIKLLTFVCEKVDVDQYTPIDIYNLYKETNS